jgi:tetratricopeptide (TPR) repeat protein
MKNNEPLPIQQYLDEQLTETAEEALLTALLKQQHKNEFKAYWTKRSIADFSATIDHTTVAPHKLPISKATTTPHNTHKNRQWQMWVAAASIAALFIGLWFWNSPADNSPLAIAQQQWQQTPAPTLNLNRSGEPNSQVLIDQALVQYKQGKYQTALDQLLPLVAQNEQAALLAGMCAVELQQTDRAIGFFKQIMDMPNALSKDQAQWRLALAYTMAGQLSQAQPILQQIVQNKAWQYEKAQELLQTINTQH